MILSAPPTPAPGDAPFLETHPGPLIVPTLVITEVTHLLGTRVGADAEVRFLGDLAAGNLLAESVVASDWMRIAELVAAPSGTRTGKSVGMSYDAESRADASDGARKPKKRWSDLSPAARAAIVLGGFVELIVTTIALRDLLRRPAAQVPGPKLPWLVGFVVQPFGPLAYLAWGRRPVTTR